jgi:hypothetical protein
MIKDLLNIAKNKAKLAFAKLKALGSKLKVKALNIKDAILTKIDELKAKPKGSNVDELLYSSESLLSNLREKVRELETDRNYLHDNIHKIAAQKQQEQKELLRAIAALQRGNTPFGIKEQLATLKSVNDCEIEMMLKELGYYKIKTQREIMLEKKIKELENFINSLR